VAEQNYWVRTEQGRTWGPFTLTALERLRGQLTEKAEASLDGQTWRPGTEFPELRDLLSPARKIEKVARPAASSNPPRISKAIAEAFGIKQDQPAPEPEAKKAPKKPPKTIEQAPPAPVYRWYHKASALLFIVFCLEVGVVLLVFPWSEYWDNNFFANWIPMTRELWDNSYVRGAVSGLGIVNIFISFSELFRLRRFSKQQ